METLDLPPTYPAVLDVLLNATTTLPVAIISYQAELALREIQPVLDRLTADRLATRTACGYTLTPAGRRRLTEIRHPNRMEPLLAAPWNR